MEMITVYLDKNVLSHILTVRRTGAETAGVAQTHIDQLKAATEGERIRNMMSVMQIQEAAYALNAGSANVAKEELDLLRELLWQDKVLKFPNDLLFENIVNYANGNGPADPLMDNNIDLDGLFNSDGDIEERRQTLAQTTKEDEEFSAKARVANVNDREVILAEFGNAKPSYEEFYKTRIEERLKGLVQGAEKHYQCEGLLAACENRGFGGMLEFPTLATAAGASISYQYARVFGELSEKESKRKGDLLI
jgi:hypothetical protein